MQLLFHDIFNLQNDKIEFSHAERFICEESFLVFIDLRKVLPLLLYPIRLFLVNSDQFRNISNVEFRIWLVDEAI